MTSRGISQTSSLLQYHPLALFVLVLALCASVSAFSMNNILPFTFVHRHRGLHAPRGSRLETASCTCRAAMQVAPASPSSVMPSASGICGDVDSVLASVLMHAARNIQGFDLTNIEAASSGLQVWSAVLKRGRLPDYADFPYNVKWPEDPLFSRFTGVLADLQMPRFVMRHPDTASAVLLSMLQLTIDFIEQSQSQSHSARIDDALLPQTLQPAEEHAQDTATAEQNSQPGDLELLAQELAAELQAQWGGVVGGVDALDQLFGAQHGLLDALAGGGGSGSFGLHDGVWSHSGWRALPALQRQLTAMPELRTLMSALGRRPSALGKALHKFPEQAVSREKTLGVQKDPTARTSVKGLTLSGSLSDMLPSEAVLPACSFVV